HSVGDVLRDESGEPRRVFGTLQDITERKLAEHRLMAQHRVTEILAEATTLQDATPRILRTVGEGLSWDVGTLWLLDREAGGARGRCGRRMVSRSRDSRPPAARAPSRRGSGCPAASGSVVSPCTSLTSFQTGTFCARRSPATRGCTQRSPFRSSSAARSSP